MIAPWWSDVSAADVAQPWVGERHFQERSTANVAQRWVVVSRPLALAASAATRRPYDSPRVERYERSECRATLGRRSAQRGGRAVRHAS
jgi:hypothetical protein